MITKKTVLILGAGASAPYGFPTGGMLLNDVCKELEAGVHSPYANNLKNTGIEWGDLKSFGQELSGSQQLSIDRFLEHRPEFLLNGKRAIAAYLLPKERLDRITKDEPPNGWYRYFYNLLGTSLKDHVEAPITYVTFNYDRSLEYFFFHALRHSYDLSIDEAARMLGRVGIYHVHGSLGRPDFWASDGISYGTRADPDAVNRAAESILIITEANPSSADFHAAQSAIGSADRICFLGFGYHPDNITRLRISQLWRHGLDRTKRVLEGSSKGMGQAEKKHVERQLGQLGLMIKFGDSKHDALNYLREDFELI